MYFRYAQPEPSEIKKVAAEGILTCLQDAIDAFKQGLVCNLFADILMLSAPFSLILQIDDSVRMNFNTSLLSIIKSCHLWQDLYMCDAKFYEPRLLGYFVWTWIKMRIVEIRMLGWIRYKLNYITLFADALDLQVKVAPIACGLIMCWSGTMFIM